MKKQWLLIWISAVAMALLTVAVFAEYPGTKNFMKRVVIFDDSSDTMFTSNILTLLDNERISYKPIMVKKIGAQSTATSYDIDVFLWNYDINGSGDYYKKDIDYDLDIAICDAQGQTITSLGSGKWIQIVKNDSSQWMANFTSSSASYTYSTSTNSQRETLGTGDRSFNKYTIKFSGNWDLQNDSGVRVKMIATPTPTSEYVDLKPLAAIIGLKEEKSSAALGWKYYINEQRLTGSPVPEDFEAYNLVLTGTGSKNIEIEWDPTRIEINKNIYEIGGAFPYISGEVSYTQGGGSQAGWDKLVISADSYDQLKSYRNRYDIQLYKVNGEISDNWDFIASSASEGVYMTINIPYIEES